jgi:hypothetical protein
MTTPEQETTPTVTIPKWSVVLTVGDVAGDRPDVRLVDLTPESSSVESVVSALSASNLSPSDLRSRVLFVASSKPEDRDKVVAVYAALCGFSGRRLDAEVDGTELQLSEFDRALRTAPDDGRPEAVPETVQVGGPERSDLAWVDLTDGFTPRVLSAIRFARRLRFVPATDTALALSQLVAIGAVRARSGLDRFPYLVTGDEPAQMPTDEAGHSEIPGVCLHTIRRGAEELRRSMRGDTRDAVTDFVELSPRQKRLVQAAGTDLKDTLTRLGSRSKTIEVPERDDEGTLTGDLVEVLAWHCLKPANHTNGDASPSARILPTHDGTDGFRCFRCLPEKVDALRLVMWARDCTADEAADWLLAS